VFFYNSKERPLQLSDAVPLFHLHYGKWRHMPPRDLQYRLGRQPEALLSWPVCWARPLTLDSFSTW